MESSFPLFFKIRAITFTVVILLSFSWLVLLSVQISARWTMSDRISQSLMILFILTNTTTLILLPILILVEFRIWLDAARLLLLLVLHVGSAAATTYWSPRIQCPDRTLDDIGICQLIGVYTVIACWIIPAILVCYSTYFAVVVHLESCVPVIVDLEIGPTDSPSSWREILKETVGAQASGSADTRMQRRPLMLPTMVKPSRSLLPLSLIPQVQPRSTLPNAPPRQSTIPSLSHASQQYHSAPGPVPSRHHSLPVFKYDSGPHIRPSFTLANPVPLTIDAHSSDPQTWSSHSFSTSSPPNPQNRFANFPLSAGDVQSPRTHRWCSKLSLMSPSSSCRGMEGAEGSPATPRSARTKLSKPLPTHFM